jgi:hypothetical protein
MRHETGGFVFSPRSYKLSSQRRHSSYGARFSARGRQSGVFLDPDEPMRDVRKSGEEQAADSPLLRLFSQIVNSFEARYTDDQTPHGLMPYVMAQVAIRGMNREP